MIQIKMIENSMHVVSLAMLVLHWNDFYFGANLHSTKYETCKYLQGCLTIFLRCSNLHFSFLEMNENRMQHLHTNNKLPCLRVATTTTTMWTNEMKMQPTDASSRRLRRYSERSVEAVKTSLTIHPSSVVLKKNMAEIYELWVRNRKEHSTTVGHMHMCTNITFNANLFGWEILV